jgi:hypothetical protein
MADDEWERWFKRAFEAYKDGDLPAERSPLRKPPDRLAHLNPEVRMMLGEMSAEDARTLRAALRFYRSANTVSKFLRWLLITCALALGGGAAFGDHIANLWKALFGGKAG